MVHIVGPPGSLKTSIIDLGVKIFEVLNQQNITPVIVDPYSYTSDEIYGSDDLINLVS